MDGFALWGKEKERIANLFETNPFGDVVCLNLNDSYVVKKLDYVVKLADVGASSQELVVGFQCDEPLFVVGLNVLKVVINGGGSYTSIDSESFEYLNPLEKCFMESKNLPELTNYKIGREHFRKEGSWFLFRIITPFLYS